MHTTYAYFVFDLSTCSEAVARTISAFVSRLLLSAKENTYYIHDNIYTYIYKSTVKPHNARTFCSRKSARLTVDQIRSYDAYFLFKAFLFKA